MVKVGNQFSHEKLQSKFLALAYPLLQISTTSCTTLKKLLLRLSIEAADISIFITLEVFPKNFFHSLVSTSIY